MINHIFKGVKNNFFNYFEFFKKYKIVEIPFFRVEKSNSDQTDIEKDKLCTTGNKKDFHNKNKKEVRFKI